MSDEEVTIKLVSDFADDEQVFDTFADAMEVAKETPSASVTVELMRDDIKISVPGFGGGLLS